jgi:hypothetical protein
MKGMVVPVGGHDILVDNASVRIMWYRSNTTVVGLVIGPEHFTKRIHDLLIRDLPFRAPGEFDCEIWRGSW